MHIYGFSSSQSEVLDHYLPITPGSDLVEVVTDADSDEDVGECSASVPHVEANDQEEAIDLGMSASCRSIARLNFDSLSD